ncbi:MAG: hypothetical protein ACTS8S_21160 [Giesbergeria sp.]
MNILAMILNDPGVDPALRGDVGARPAAPAARGLAPHPQRYLKADHIVTIRYLGADFICAWDGDRDELSDPWTLWIDAVQIGGQWFHASDALSDAFERGLNEALGDALREQLEGYSIVRPARAGVAA